MGLSLTSGNIFLTYEAEVDIFLAVLKNSLAHGLRQLTRETKSDVSCLQRSLRAVTKNAE